MRQGKAYHGIHIDGYHGWICRIRESRHNASGKAAAVLKCGSTRAGFGGGGVGGAGERGGSGEGLLFSTYSPVGRTGKCSVQFERESDSGFAISVGEYGDNLYVPYGRDELEFVQVAYFLI